MDEDIFGEKWIEEVYIPMIIRQRIRISEINRIINEEKERKEQNI
jgi:hypothetical protein